MELKCQPCGKKVVVSIDDCPSPHRPKTNCCSGCGAEYPKWFLDIAHEADSKGEQVFVISQILSLLLFGFMMLAVFSGSSNYFSWRAGLGIILLPMGVLSIGHVLCNRRIRKVLHDGGIVV